jgi:Protein of unknown function (DUF550)
MSTEQEQPDDERFPLMSAEQRAAFWEREAVKWRDRALQAWRDRALQARLEVEEQRLERSLANAAITGKAAAEHPLAAVCAECDKLRAERDKLAEASERDFFAFAEAQAVWSRVTFGSDEERGPTGALKHLAKEVQEALEHPSDPMEYVDCLFLTLDAARRSGTPATKLLELAWQKLEINEGRTWARPTSDEPIEHEPEKFPWMKIGMIPEGYFWPCDCMEPGWQKESGKRQPRCGVCLTMRDLLDQQADQLAIELQRLIRARFLISSWLAANLPTEEMVRIPRDVARLSAGWG